MSFWYAIIWRRAWINTSWRHRDIVRTIRTGVVSTLAFSSPHQQLLQSKFHLLLSSFSSTPSFSLTTPNNYRAKICQPQVSLSLLILLLLLLSLSQRPIAVLPLASSKSNEQLPQISCLLPLFSHQNIARMSDFKNSTPAFDPRRAAAENEDRDMPTFSAAMRDLEKLPKPPMETAEDVAEKNAVLEENADKITMAMGMLAANKQPRRRPAPIKLTAAAKDDGKKTAGKKATSPPPEPISPMAKEDFDPLWNAYAAAKEASKENSAAEAAVETANAGPSAKPTHIRPVAPPQPPRPISAEEHAKNVANPLKVSFQQNPQEPPETFYGDRARNNEIDAPSRYEVLLT
jgi:hypothetical protein